jgi:hypothetical protein
MVWSFQFMIHWLYCFGFVGRQHVMARVPRRAKPATSWPERERKEGRGGKGKGGKEKEERKREGSRQKGEGREGRDGKRGEGRDGKRGEGKEGRGPGPIIPFEGRPSLT